VGDPPWWEVMLEMKRIQKENLADIDAQKERERKRVTAGLDEAPTSPESLPVGLKPGADGRRWRVISSPYGCTTRGK
jgi:hypothetical protein